MLTDFHNFWQTHTTGNLQIRHIINPPKVFCVPPLPCKISIAAIVMIFTAEEVTVLFWQYLSQFSYTFHNFRKSYLTIIKYKVCLS